MKEFVISLMCITSLAYLTIIIIIAFKYTKLWKSDRRYKKEYKNLLKDQESLKLESK